MPCAVRRAGQITSQPSPDGCGRIAWSVPVAELAGKERLHHDGEIEMILLSILGMLAFVIGPTEAPYLLRWWILPRNRIFNIYLHRILADDDDRAMHCHPWWNLSWVFGCGYREITPNGVKIRPRFSLVLRRATAIHRLELFRDSTSATIPTWSIFFTGPVIR